MSALKKQAIAAVEAYNSWDIEQIMSFRAPSSTHEILPKSLNRPIMTHQSYRAYFSAIMPYFHNFHVVIADVVEDRAENKVAVWASSTGRTEIGEYRNEYMLVFYFEDGASIMGGDSEGEGGTGGENGQGEEKGVDGKNGERENRERENIGNGEAKELKIIRCLEFVDSATTKPYMIELAKYIKEKKGSDGFEKRYEN